jgi:dCMP deaminase
MSENLIFKITHCIGSYESNGSADYIDGSEYVTICSNDLKWLSDKVANFFPLLSESKISELIDLINKINLVKFTADVLHISDIEFENLNKIKQMLKTLTQTITLSNGQKSIIRKTKAIKYYRQAMNFANEFSKDPSTKVGAIFIYPGTMQILSMGYNGMPRGIDETISNRWDRPQKYKWTEHAERNAIYNAAQCGTPLRDSICISTLSPCADCARGIIQSGCKMVITYDDNELAKDNPEVVARWQSDCEMSLVMFKEAGIHVMILSKDEIQSKD